MCVLVITSYESSHIFIKESLKQIKLDFAAAKATCANTLQDLLLYSGIKRPLPPEIISF